MNRTTAEGLSVSDASDGPRLTRLYEELRLRLLDLSKRNQLLNYSMNARSKRFLQIIDGSLENVHRRLAGDEATLQVTALPEPDDTPSEERTEEFRSALDRARATDVEYLTAVEAIEATGRDDESAMEKLDRQLRNRVRQELGLPPRSSRKDLNRAEHARSLGIDPSIDLSPSRDPAGDRVLQTLKFPDELEAVLEKISSDARLAEQEMGLSTLFLAFGFLEWYESDNSDKKAYAPLLLLPVQIEKQKVRGKPVYSIAASEGGAEANLSLQKLLERNFSRNLPDFEVSDEDTLGSIEAYIDQVKIAIDGLKRWQVRRWLVLGHFSFGRFAMYADLEPEKWGQPADNTLVGALLRGWEQKDDGESLPSMPDDYLIDDPEIEAIAPFLIQDADASQHSTLVDVMKGANLVIQGPPGTGKSQTITNIIANALAVGKRVLFLAEKQAALEVVKRRLDRAGLGDFCLELHSDKVSPKAVVASLAERYDLGTGRDLPAATQRIDPTWQQSRQVIASYVQALHEGTSDGSTAFSLIWQTLRGYSQHADLINLFRDVKFPIELLQSSDRLVEIGGAVEIFANSSRRFTDNFGHPSGSPWSQVHFGDIPTYDAPRFLQALLALQQSARLVEGAIVRHSGLGVVGVDDFQALADLDSRLSDTPEIAALVAIADLDLQDLERALAVRSELLRTESDLAAVSDLRHENPERLAIAAAIMRLASATEFAEQGPAPAYKFANGEATTLQQLADAVEAMLPVVKMLGLGRVIPASLLTAVATTVCFLSNVPKHCLCWLVGLPHVSEAAIVDAVVRWRALVDAEGSWASKLAGYKQNARPAAGDLEIAASTLGKTGARKVFAALSGSVRAARELCQRLGIDASPVELNKLAAHLRAIQAFEADESLRSLFGLTWRGLDTPMEEVRDGIKQRDLLRETLLSLPGGEEVVESAMVLSAEAIASLSSVITSCESFLALLPDARARLDGTAVDKFVSDARRRVATLREFLMVDRDRLLVDVEVPIRRLAYAHSLLERAARIRATLASHATADHADQLGSSDDRIVATIQAIAWIRSVRASNVKDAVKTMLLSHSAGEVREALRQAARDWAAISEGTKAARLGLLEFDAGAIATVPSSQLVTLIDDLSAHSQELGDFVALRQQRHQLDNAGVSEFLSACDRHAVEPGRISSLFAAVVAERRATIMRRVPALAIHNGASLEARRRAFAERDIAKIKADRATVRARLLKATPPVGSQSGPRKTWTEMRLLTNEFPKVKRFTPVRQLLARAGSAAQVLKPCFMMSPLSLAKFVAPKSLQFDLLVIDEASQMRPEDALGGMLRAGQIVVVGDAKQLPPTDFFARAEGQLRDDGIISAEDDDDINAESILEACESTFGNRRRLKWHYRSRCESLIAFSNRTFYEDALITFPTAKPGSFSVNLVRVDGTYRARRNPAEAARVAEETVAFMRHFADAPEDELPTLGIVAVNVEQRDFIMEELRRISADDELVERYLEKTRAKREPLFVKNLENVQGDERDHIFISMTYGRRHGEPAVAQNFGPINRKQGHRRLNVLFTRARVRIGLFVSFGSADVRPTESSSEGIHALKSYLEYAETQGRAIVRGIGGEADSDFEVEVADRLRMKGYEVDLQVGVSGFRIDLGVRHPDHPERFLAGVECDGAAYHSSKSARDRDRLREEVLSSLGWDIVRVWSTDWFDNPSLETEKLVRQLENLRNRPAPFFDSYPPLHDADPAITSDHEAELKPDIVDSNRHCEKPISASSETPSEPFDRPGVLFDPENPPRSPARLDDDRPLTVQEATSFLEKFRDDVIRPSMADWEPQRSILRAAMIETFVQQRITDPSDWYNRIPHYLRTGTNPAEKARFLQDICEIVERIDTSRPEKPGRDIDGTEPIQGTPNSEVSSADPTFYRFAELTAVGHPDRERFFDADYTPILKAMIAHVIEVEGPIFEDVLVDRVARSHGLRRSGSQIRRRVVSLLPSNVLRADEADRKVVWPANKTPGVVHVYRKDPTGARDHEDIPVEELAAIATPFVRLRMQDEAVLRKMVEEFELGRLREATRARFEAALQIARQSAPSS